MGQQVQQTKEALEELLGEEVPEKVAEVTKPIRDPEQADLSGETEEPWTATWLPAAVKDNHGEKHWRVVPREDEGVHTEMAWVDDWGYVYDEDMFWRVSPDGPYYPADPELEGRIVYTEDFMEADTLVLQHPGMDKVRLSYRGGVIADYEYVISDLPDDLWEVITAIVSGTGWVSTDAWRGYYDGPDSIDSWVKVSSGWHSGMERSELSDAINEITAGEAGFDFPVIVCFPLTSNVCAIGLEVYAPEPYADQVDAYLSGKTAGRVGGVS